MKLKLTSKFYLRNFQTDSCLLIKQNTWQYSKVYSIDTKIRDLMVSVLLPPINIWILLPLVHPYWKGPEYSNIKNNMPLNNNRHSGKWIHWGKTNEEVLVTWKGRHGADITRFYGTYLLGTTPYEYHNNKKSGKSRRTAENIDNIYRWSGWRCYANRVRIL